MILHYPKIDPTIGDTPDEVESQPIPVRPIAATDMRAPIEVSREFRPDLSRYERTRRALETLSNGCCGD